MALTSTFSLKGQSQNHYAHIYIAVVFSSDGYFNNTFAQFVVGDKSSNFQYVDNVGFKSAYVARIEYLSPEYNDWNFAYIPGFSHSLDTWSDDPVEVIGPGGISAGTRFYVFKCIVPLMSVGFTSVNDPRVVCDGNFMHLNGFATDPNYNSNYNWEHNPTYLTINNLNHFIHVDHNKELVIPSTSVNVGTILRYRVENNFNQLLAYHFGIGGFSAISEVRNFSVALSSSLNNSSLSTISLPENPESSAFLPVFKFPESRNIEVNVSECRNEDTRIKVPVSETGDYIITLSMNGVFHNISSNDLIFENGYYIIDWQTKNVNGSEIGLLHGNASIQVEHKKEIGINVECPSELKSFEIPSIIDFEITSVEYVFQELDNSGKLVQIPKIGKKGRVDLTVEGNPERLLTVTATSNGEPEVFVFELEDNQKVISIELLAGDYTVTVANGHCVSPPVIVKLQEPESISFVSKPNVISCHETSKSGNTSNGAIQLESIMGGIGEYTFKLNGIDVHLENELLITGLTYSQNGYVVLVQDASGNFATDVVVVGQNEPIELETKLHHPTLWCANDGKVEILGASGGIADYNYSKHSEGSFTTSKLLDGFGNGLSMVYVKDSKECVFEKEVTMQAPAPLELVEQSTTIPTCIGGEDGAIEFKVSGLQGNNPAYELSPSVDGVDFHFLEGILKVQNLKAGTYFLSVTDALLNNQCTLIDTFTIYDRDAYVVSGIVYDVLNKGKDDGGISIELTNNDGRLLNFSLYEGLTNVLIDAELSVVDDTYSYESLLGSPSGYSYYIKIVDEKGCFYKNELGDEYFSFKVFEPQESLFIELEAMPLLACPNSLTQINLLASAGWGAPYLFKKEDEDWGVESSFSSLSAGVYNFYVKDSKGGVSSLQVEFVAPTPVRAGLSVNNVTCNGKNNGVISIKDLEGGSGRYQWKYGNNNSWLNPSESAKNISPGSYDIYLKDSENSCQEVNIGVAIITEPHLLKIDDVNVTDPICADGLGAATIYVSGGNNDYRYKIMKGNVLVMEFPNESDEFSYLKHFTFQNLSAGDYTVSVSDVGECIIDDSFTVAQYQNPKIDSYTFADVSCNGLTDGYIEIKNVSGSDNVFQLFMSEGSLELEEVNLSADSKVKNLAPGSYTMLLKDTKNCESEPLMVTIGQPEQLGLEVRAIVPEIVFGNGDGLIRARTVGGKLKGSMKIKTKRLLGEDESEMLPVRDVAAGHQFELAGLSGGLYEIEVTDSNGCVFTSEKIEVPAPPSPLQIEIVSVKDALCNARLGSFQIKGSGGWGDYTYRLATHTGTTSISNYEELSAGSYKVFVQDKLGASVSTLIEIGEPGKLEVKATDHIDPTCGNNGTLKLEVSGGAEPYKVSIDNWLSSKILDLPGLVEFEGKAAGGYSVKVEDKNGCEALAITDLSASSLLKIDRFVTQSPSAEGAEDGLIAVIVSGGGTQLTYEWRNITQNGALLSLNQSKILGIGSGYYEVLISQSEGCAVSDRIYLPSVSDGLLDIKELGHETRFEAADGYAVLVSSLENITSIEIYYPGNRVDVLTDDDLPVEQGEISLVNLPSGSYLVKAFGENEVEISVFNIVPYEPFVFQNVDVNNVSKPGEDDGSVMVFITGGAPGFSYNWYDATGELLDVLFEPFGNVAKAHGLIAGNYRVDVTDVYENTISYDFVVLQPDAELQITVSRFQNQSCNGFDDAWVQVGAVGGWSNYQYKHEASGTFQNYLRWNNLPIGQHTFFVIDQKGVENSVSITITQPDVLSATIERIDGVQCFGESNGKVFFDISGGTAPYKYALVSSQPVWQNKTANFDEPDDERIFYFDDGLSAGTLLYQFTDANNCPFEGSVTVVVPHPEVLSLSDADVAHTTCNLDNGRVAVEISGGTMPYRFQWSNAAGATVGSDFFVENLKQNGFYRLNVWDKHNCHLNTEFFINPSTLPEISGLETSPVLCYGDSNGSATVKEVTASVPYAPYELHWSNNATGFSTDGLKAGRYFVTVRDANQCETTRYFNIATPDTLGLSVLKLKDAHCYGYNDGEIEVLAFGGVGGYNFSWSNGDTGSAAVNLRKGAYSLKYTDANNCLFEASFVIDEPPVETVSIGEDVTMCPGNSIEIDGQNFVAHQWTKDDKLLSTERYLTVSDEGYYNLRVINAVGCFAYDTIRVSIGNDALKADFLMASQAFVGDTIMIFELSNLPLDHLTWEFSTHGFSDHTPVDAQNYILHLKALNQGMYNVVLNAFSGGCFSKKVKQVEVKSERLSDEEENALGYKDPLIKSFVVSPNPNDGRFMVHIELKEESSIQLSVFSISRGVKLEERTRTGFNFYSETFTLGNVNTGVYVVILNAGNERRQVKIIIE